MAKQIQRREFLKYAAATGATTAFTIVPAYAAPRSKGSKQRKELPPSERVNVAMVGDGGIARMAYGSLEGHNIVAVCDVVGARNSNPGTKRFFDFRVMYDKMGKEIDGVCVNTPDHTHFVATIDAMRRGYHVCTQKPLTHNIWESRTLLKAARKYRPHSGLGPKARRCPRPLARNGNSPTCEDGVRMRHRNDDIRSLARQP